MALLASEYLEGVVVQLPAIIKASEVGGKRMIEVEASSEALDAEGDIIAQKALLDSASEFVKTGHLDIDHISELGARMGIKDPESYIVGRPTEVKDIGEGRTSVVGQILRARDGVHDPIKNRYDAFWDSMMTKPPIKWRASVYGFPKGGMVDDCRETICSSGAKRFHIKGMSWRSLALTRNPVNESLTGYAKIVTAKAFVDIYKAANAMPPVVAPFDGHDAGPCVGEPCNGELANSMGPSGPDAATAAPMMFSMPRNLMDAVGQYHTHMKSCPHTEGINSTPGFKAHFKICCGMDDGLSDLYAHALMHHLLLARRRVG